MKKFVPKHNVLIDISSTGPLLPTWGPCDHVKFHQSGYELVKVWCIGWLFIDLIFIELRPLPKLKDLANANKPVMQTSKH